jgi:hypothetical protein
MLRRRRVRPSSHEPASSDAGGVEPRRRGRPVRRCAATSGPRASLQGDRRQGAPAAAGVVVGVLDGVVVVMAAIAGPATAEAGAPVAHDAPAGVQVLDRRPTGPRLEPIAVEPVAGVGDADLPPSPGVIPRLSAAGVAGLVDGVADRARLDCRRPAAASYHQSWPGLLSRFIAVTTGAQRCGRPGAMGVGELLSASSGAERRAVPVIAGM